MLGYLLKIKLKYIFYKLCALFLLIYGIYMLNSHKKFLFNDKLPTIIWWTPFYNTNLSKIINCKINNCLLTENRKVLDTETIVYLFYGSKFDISDLPLPRKKSDLWAMLHEESPKNLALFLDEKSQKLFNFSSTFSRFSNFPITLQYLPNIDVLKSTKYLVPVEEKNRLLNDISPILYIQSDCQTPLERDSYVKELMKYISVDSYGKCLNNRVLPEKLMENPLNNLYSDDFMNFVAQYKFVISFENAICDDYITEKLWRPLIAGSVPIYMGSPSIKDWLPNNYSAIIANEFTSPKKLSKYILMLNNNDELYNNYLAHKFGEIQNEKLINNLKDRTWNVDSEEGTHFFEEFECYICDNINNVVHSSNIYNCPLPISPITRKKNESNWWNLHWDEGKCQAKILTEFLTNQTKFTKEMFDAKVNELQMKNSC